jgi:hypothetical protein
MINVLWLLAGVLFGIYVASKGTASAWANNADCPTRISYKCVFYKVVRIDNPDSWRMMRIHDPKEQSKMKQEN